MKTTKKDFEIYKKEADYWLDKFQLRSWEIRYAHLEHEHIDEALAWCETHWTGRVATLGIF